jgi:hypothetical protein
MELKEGASTKRVDAATRNGTQPSILHPLVELVNADLAAMPPDAPRTFLKENKKTKYAANNFQEQNIITLTSGREGASKAKNY